MTWSLIPTNIKIEHMFLHLWVTSASIRKQHCVSQRVSQRKQNSWFLGGIWMNSPEFAAG